MHQETEAGVQVQESGTEVQIEGYIGVKPVDLKTMMIMYTLKRYKVYIQRHHIVTQ